MRCLCLCSSADVPHVVREQRVQLRRNKLAEHDGLAQISRIAVEIPVPYSSEITAVGILRDQIQVLEYMLHMVPVLHHQCVCLVDYNKLDRRKKVVISLLVILIPNRHPQPERRRKHDIRIVELRKQLHRLPGELEAKTEHVIVVPLEQRAKVVWLVFANPLLLVREDVRFLEPLLVFLLLGLGEGDEGFQNLCTRVPCGEDEEDLGPGEALVAKLEVFSFRTTAGEACIVFENLVAGSACSPPVSLSIRGSKSRIVGEEEAYLKIWFSACKQVILLNSSAFPEVREQNSIS